MFDIHNWMTNKEANNEQTNHQNLKPKQKQDKVSFIFSDKSDCLVVSWLHMYALIPATLPYAILYCDPAFLSAPLVHVGK